MASQSTRQQSRASKEDVMARLVMFWLASLVAVAVVTTTLTLAQVRREVPRVVSGADLGFRVEGTDPSGNASGVFVVRLNGKWVPISSMPTVRPLK
jgi:hypothetical protein